ncbi:ABC transporter ATP-binding protein [unidentified bacterial endosymbiont]|uniref:ABC transporter ATP-binding protein n=1 Tax=unidentified bacterial endosymbiont TaxID=2355 RepID=UPI0020A1B479|nr:ABC transporter ATP-binding protein [unidentified bacterial endosymbiont]
MFKQGAKSSQSSLQFALQCLKPFRGWIVGAFLVGTFWAIDLSLRPYLLKIILDKIPRLTPEEVIPELAAPTTFYIIMTLLTTLILRFHDFIWIKINYPLQRSIGDRLMNNMMQHSQELLQNQFVGNLGNKIKEAMTGIPELLILFIHKFFSHFLSLLIAIFTLWQVNVQCALLLSGWITIFMLIAGLLAKRAEQLIKTAVEVRSQVIGYLIDILSNFMTIRLLATRHYESQRLLQQLDRNSVAGQQRDWYFLRVILFQTFSFVVYQTLSLLALIYGFKAGQVTAGDFILILTVNISIIQVLRSLSEDISRAAELIGNINQGVSIALIPLTLQDAQPEQSLQVHQGTIVFDQVTFNYQGAATLFYKQSVTIAAGQKIGLVGYSGSGKTTFINLILRLYDVTAGTIVIDGQDIRQVTQDSLHKAIGLIPQDPLLFHRSLLENIRYGRLEASDAEVITAAKQAQADDFIVQLPQGYASLVGERGVKLSGGQRQRIAIARVLLKNAPILILDEATSQLDSVTEQVIQQSLKRLMHGKTSIVIAHRLSTLLQMDRILVLKAGKIIEDGPHHALLAQGGLYKTLWEAQVGGLLDLGAPARS